MARKKAMAFPNAFTKMDIFSNSEGCGLQVFSPLCFFANPGYATASYFFTLKLKTEFLRMGVSISFLKGVTPLSY